MLAFTPGLLFVAVTSLGLGDLDIDKRVVIFTASCRLLANSPSFGDSSLRHIVAISTLIRYIGVRDTQN